MRIKGVLSNLWTSDSGQTYLCVASEGGVIRYRNICVEDIAAAEEVFRLPFVPRGVWGLDEEHVYCWGQASPSEGTHEHRVSCFDGEQWTGLPDTPFEVLALHGCAPDCLYAVGHKGILRWDGQGWHELPAPTSESLTSVFVASPERVFVGGYGGSVLEGSAAGFGVVATLTSNLPVFAVAEFKGQLYVGGGPLGLFRREGTGGELVCIKDKIKATGLESRESLLIAAGVKVAWTTDGVAFTSNGTYLSEDTAHIDPRSA
jgi:hypothetical protein